MIRIKKVTDGSYSAEVFTLPPNLDWAKPEWVASKPMSADELIRKLLTRRHHETDLGDHAKAAIDDQVKSGHREKV